MEIDLWTKNSGAVTNNYPTVENPMKRQEETSRYSAIIHAYIQIYIERERAGRWGFEF